MGLCGGTATRGKGKRRRYQKKVTTFKYGGPAVPGDSFPLFDDGRCYRVEADKRKWFLYNDTLNMEVHIHFTFQKGTAVHKCKHSRTEVKKMPGGAKQCSIVVYPLETVPFVKFDKSPINYSAANMSRGLDASYIERVNREARAKCADETRRVAGVAGVTHDDEELLYKCRKGKTPYVDMSFQPAPGSLRRPTDKKAVANMDAVTWRRPQHYIPAMAHKEIRLFRAGIDAGDIGQGQLGDCWLMCAIAVVAESTTMIKDIFGHPVSKSKRAKEEKAGGYRVYINKSGWFHNVIVDDYLPTFNGAVYFARSAGDPYELWVSLLEKAYAKIHGSYASIIGGNPLHALQDLTGFPVYAFTTAWKRAAVEEEAASQFFKDLLRYRKKGYLISISTPGTDSSAYNVGSGGRANEAAMEARYKAAGLNTGHAYSVLKVRQFVIPRVKLLKIRNPWGSGDEWTGAWGKNSDKWKKHSLVRRACKPSKESDGTFWMEWKDAVQYFEGGGVCMVKKAWYQYRFPGKFVGVNPSTVLKVELKKRQKVFFTLSQKDRRLLSPNDPEQLYKGLLISVLGHDAAKGMHEIVALSSENPEVHPPQQYEYIVARDVGLELELDPAQSPFYVVPRIMVANRNGPKEFTLGMLTPNKSTESGLRVSFVQLPDTCPTFRNVVSFKLEGDTAAHVRFQYKKRGGAPRMKDGVTVFGATNVKEEFPFPY